MATVVHAYNPLTPSERIVSQGFGTLAQLAPKTDMPFVLFRNGEATLRAYWHQSANDDDVLIYVVLPLGGGGGGKNILRTVAIIAASVLGAGAGGAIAASFGVTSATGLAVGSAIGASLAVAAASAVLPPPRLPSSRVGADLAAPSPTYTLGAQGNFARPGQTIPILYGRHQLFPDLADQVLIYYADDLKTQFIDQIFMVGQGHYVIESAAFEDTPVTSFAGVSFSLYSPADSSSIKNSLGIVKAGIFNAAEVSGQELLGPFGSALQYVGPYVINPAGTSIAEFQIDVALPKGLFFANDNGGLDERSVEWYVEARLIDDEGTALSDFIRVSSGQITTTTTTPDTVDENGNVTPGTTVTQTQAVDYAILTLAENTPLRQSTFYQLQTFFGVSAGRVEVRLARRNAKEESARVANDLLWASAAGVVYRSSSLPAQAFSNDTASIIKLSARATNSLNSQSSRRFNVIATRKISHWSPSGGWGPLRESRSIVWAFADALRNQVYGGGVPDDRIALDELHALDQFYESRGMFFDGIFDNKITLFEALALIGRAGRATPVLANGKITLIRDAQKTLPVALFSMRNMRKGSFSVSYLVPTEETTNAVTVEYLDESNFKPKKITVVQPGTSGNRPLEVRLFGVTGATQATNEARYLVASNQYRRRTVRFSTEMDGFVCRYGDPILVSHEMTQWGISGDVVSFDPATKQLTLSEPVVLDGDCVIELTRKDGSVAGPYAVFAGPDEFTVRAPSLNYTPEIATTFERPRFSIGTSTTYRQRCKITGLQPRGIASIDVTAVVDDDAVYTFASDTAQVSVSQAPARFAGDAETTKYDAANEQQRDAQAYYARVNGKMSNDHAGYVYGGT